MRRYLLGLVVASALLVGAGFVAQAGGAGLGHAMPHQVLGIIWGD
jgi:hypothetical protein